MAKDPAKFQEPFPDPTLLAIDTSMVIITGVDLGALGGGKGPGSAHGGGGGGGVVNQGGAAAFYAVCGYGGHDPGDGVQESGLWTGPARPSRSEAAADGDGHAQAMGHQGGTTVTVEIGGVLAGPVLGS